MLGRCSHATAITTGCAGVAREYALQQLGGFERKGNCLGWPYWAEDGSVACSKSQSWRRRRTQLIRPAARPTKTPAGLAGRPALQNIAVAGCRSPATQPAGNSTSPSYSLRNLASIASGIMPNFRRGPSHSLAPATTCSATVALYPAHSLGSKNCRRPNRCSS